MGDIFKIIKGNLKQVNVERPWQNYLVGKELILATQWCGGWALLAISGEKTLYEFCKYAWEAEPDQEHEYETYKSMYEDIVDGNYGFGFDEDEIEVIEIQLEHDFEKGENVKSEVQNE
jgi:hypothetical protein